MSDLFRRYQLIAAVLFVVFIFSFTAWGSTTYSSTRHFVGAVADQPETASDLQAQYEDMTAYFASGTGDSYVYIFRSSPITVTKAQVADKSRDDVINLVLDTYASQFHNNELASGGPDASGILINGTGNLIYLIMAMVTAVAFLAVMARVFLSFPDHPRSHKLKSTGKALAIACACAFVLFALLPWLLRSIFWSAITEGGADDVWNMVEPVILSSLLLNTVIALVLAIALYALGYWLALKGSHTGTSGAHRE